MSTIFAKLTGSEFDAMVDRGAFDCIKGKKVELIRGELRFMNPVDPLRQGEEGRRQSETAPHEVPWSVV